jgi:DNA polymerase-1
MADPKGRAGRVFLVDGTALLYRAYFAFIRSPLTTSKGERVSAVYGFASAIFQLLKQEKPEWMAVAFDLAAPTFRHEQFAAYKAQRPAMADELAAQVPRVKQLTAAIGLRIIEQEGVEADDWIGCLSQLALDQGHDVVVVSSDKDFMQLVGPRVLQWIPPNQGGEGQWIDEAAVKARWGVPPEGMIDLLALMGDSSDNVPGVAGIGERTAAQLLQQFGSLDEIYAHLDQVEKKAVRERLEKGREDAYMSRDLVRIRCNLPVPCALEDLRVPPLGSGGLLVPLLRELEFRRFLEELAPVEETSWSGSYEVADTEEAVASLLARWEQTRPPRALGALTASPSGRGGNRPGLGAGARVLSSAAACVGSLAGRGWAAACARDPAQAPRSDPRRSRPQRHRTEPQVGPARPREPGSQRARGAPRHPHRLLPDRARGKPSP